MRAHARYLAITALMGVAFFYMALHHNNPTPLPSPLSDFPSQIGDWRMIGSSHFDQQTLKVLKPTDYMAKRYMRPDGAVVDLYVGYHDGAQQAGPLHSPKNCLPGSGWFEASSENITIPLGDGNLPAVSAVYQKGAVSELFIYWYMVGGTSVSDEYHMKMLSVMDSIQHGRQDACFIRISVPMTNSKSKAVQQAIDFLKTAQPILKLSLPS